MHGGLRAGRAAAGVVGARAGRERQPPGPRPKRRARGAASSWNLPHLLRTEGVHARKEQALFSEFRLPAPARCPDSDRQTDAGTGCQMLWAHSLTGPLGFLEAEHGYASMLPYSSKDRDAFKRRSKTKKNSTSSR